MDDEIIDLEEPEEILYDTGEFEDQPTIVSNQENLNGQNHYVNLNRNQNIQKKDSSQNLNQKNRNEKDNIPNLNRDNPNLNKEQQSNDKNNQVKDHKNQQLNGDNKQNSMVNKNQKANDNKNLSPFNRTPNFMKNNSSNNDSNRINQALNKNNSIMKNPLSQSNNQKSDVEQEKQEKENNIKGNQKTETTFQASFSFLDLLKKRKMIILISVLTMISVGIILLITMVGGLSTDDDLGKDTSGYVTGGMSEEELLAQLEYYGYCNSESSCKKQGAYKFFKELKSVYDEYQSKYDVSINTSLILETINYYDNATDNFETYDKDDDELENDNIFTSIWSSLSRAKKEKQMLDENVGDIKTLAEAQTEYVKETCKENGKKQVKTYYQVSFDKYISYLKYGTSSSHPNYSGRPVEIENETCEGPKNDYIETDYNDNESEVTTDSTTGNTTVTGSGKGVDIANYALQFVGNPYVYGGSSLTEGTDCSGFTMRVMEHFGISIPHSSKEQANYGTNLGTDINNAAAGDLIVYNGHVAIYLGNNSIVHASSPKSGIKVSKDASYRPIVAIVRLWG